MSGIGRPEAISQDHSASFKAEVALAAIGRDANPAELARRYDVDLAQVRQWSDELLHGAADVFRRETALRAAAAEASECTRAALPPENRWQSALEAAGAGAWELDLVSNTGWCSARHGEIFGYIGQQAHWNRARFLEHVLEDDIPAVEREVKRAVDSRTHWRFECRIRRVDGEISWIAAEARVAYDGTRPVRTWGIVTDITRRKLAEVALRDSERRLRLVSDNVPALISYIDRDLHYRFNNKQYEEWFGSSAGPATGRHVADVLGEAVYRQRLPFIEQTLAGKSVRFEGPTPHQRLGVRMTEMTYVPDLDENGTVRGMYVLGSDVTERKEAEQALREANRRKDEFLATLSHELRNPLAAICSSLEVKRLREDIARPPDRTQDILERQVEQMVRLVDDLLDVSRITQGKVDLRRERLALARAARWAMEECDGALRSAGHELYVDLPVEPLFVDADPIRLVQVISNLLTNAAKFTPHGGRIELAVMRDDRSAGSSLPADGTSSRPAPDEAGSGMIVVRDDGVGIEPALLPRVFDMFSQGEAPNGFRSGLGIGLTLVRSLVQMHGGNVEAYSEGKGRGSEFRIRLPLLPPDEPDEEPVRDLHETTAIDARVLVVDDNRDAADSLAMLLAELDVDVEVVYEGSAALAALDAYRPTTVLLDLGMPGLDGYELARRIRRHPQHRDVTLIAVTGWGGDQDVQQTRAAGFDHHMVKPVTVDALHDLLSPLDLE